MSTGSILIVVLLVLILTGHFGFSWGPWPSAGGGVILLILIILLLAGHI